MRIDFYIRFGTVPGQRLSLCGNLAVLGAGNSSNALALTYFSAEFWHGFIDVDVSQVPELKYRYILHTEGGLSIPEGGQMKCIRISEHSVEHLQIFDSWNHAGEYENIFYADPFQKTLLKENETRIKVKKAKNFNHIFKIQAPLLEKNQVVCLIGSGQSLSNWNTDSPVLLSKENGYWTASLQLPNEDLPLDYKYGVYDVSKKQFIKYELGSNRRLREVIHADQLTILHDGFVHLPNSNWKGAGVSIPVFSLRSKDSFGIGEFSDIKLLADWAKRAGLKLIQVLPVNDTTATRSWTDSYPYAAISAFALHPIYLRLASAAGKKHADLIKPLKKKQKQLNELSAIDYEQVLRFKLSTARELFNVQKEEFLKDDDFLNFFDANRHWLVPYAAFCYLRDKNGSSDFTTWKIYSNYDKAAIEKYVSPRAKHYDEIAFQYYLQFHLHLQLRDAVEYAHKNGIIIKGDIPIGVYRYSCDAWIEPELYHMDQQAGAPPDGFAVKGQNWGFPTYNWEKMSENSFEWWHRRFVQMSNYFDAFRIDHILGFFRIWSIPLHAVEGIMGRFVPARPVYPFEFSQRGMWFNPDRFCLPYINDAVLNEMFGERQHSILEYLEPTADGHYQLKDAFDTQRKVEQHFSTFEENEENNYIKQGLFDLISNVILFRDDTMENAFHFRFGIDRTISYRHLDPHMQYHLSELYIDYFFRRQDAYWMEEAMKKLPALKSATNMLICGEDLGLVPHCVPEVMKQLGILSLEIQRMPKQPGKEFFHPGAAPYLSVVTPSTHDMSTIRGWWEEDRAATQRFYNMELGQWGEAPRTCEDWINKAIILQHLYSPAMWSIFQLQDLLGMDEQIRREDAQEERINVPAVPKHYWRFRMHLNLEDLLREKEFNNNLRKFIEASGR